VEGKLLIYLCQASQYTEQGDTGDMAATDEEYIRQATEAWEEAVKIAYSEDGWKEEKRDSKTGDVVESKKVTAGGKAGRKVYRSKTRLQAPPALIIKAMSETDKVCEWNKTLLESRVLRKINDKASITYQVTADGGGGMVSSRDFVYCAISGTRDGAFIMGGRSVDYPAAPSSSKIVRAVNGPGCQMILPCEDDPNSCIVIWIMDCDYKGWMPQSVLDIAMPIAQIQFFDCLRKLAQANK